MKLQLVSITNETPDVKTFRFAPEAPFAWKPGQYLHYTLPHPNADDRHEDRWFTISSAPFEGHVAITTRLASEHGSTFKQALNGLQPGAEILAEGPEGDFVVDDPAGQFVFIAGGIGITPFRSIITQADHDGHPLNINLLYANRDDTYVFDAQLQAIAARHPEFKIHKFTDPRHIETADIQRIMAGLAQPHFYVSGPEPMAEHYEGVLKELSIADDHIHGDFFPGYPAI